MKDWGVTLIAALFMAVLSGCANQDAAKHETAVSPPSSPPPQSVTSAVRTVAEKGEEFSPDALLDQLKNKNRSFATGWTASTDIWVISIQTVVLREGVTEEEAANIAAIRAKNEIAAYMGSSVSAQEEVIMTSETGDGKTVTKEFFKSVQRVDVKQFLRGVTIFHQEVRNGKLHAAFYVTGKLMDTSAELQKQLRDTPPGTVRAVGFGIISDTKIAPAKSKALQSALRNAVEQTMGTMTVGQSQLMDNEKAKSKVISQTVGYIKQYRIVKEAKNGDNYQVIINAQVDEKHILDNYAAMVRSMGNPGFFIMTVDPDLHTVLTGFFADLGFFVTTNQADAQFIVDANCQYLGVQDSHYGNGIQIDLELRLVDAKTDQQLFSFRNIPRLTSTYSGTLHQVRQSAALKAFKTMKKQLHESLNKVVMDWVLNGHNVNVVCKGVGNDGEFSKVLEAAIAGVPCAKVHGRKKDGNILAFSCSYVGPTADFEEFLLERLRKDLPAGSTLPKTTKINLSTIELTF